MSRTAAAIVVISLTICGKIATQQLEINYITWEDMWMYGGGVMVGLGAHWAFNTIIWE